RRRHTRCLSDWSSDVCSSDLQQLYQPLDFSSFSTLQIPRLSVGISGPACVVPGSQVTYPLTISNIGSATATQGTSTITLPDGTRSEERRVGKECRSRRARSA